MPDMEANQQSLFKQSALKSTYIKLVDRSGKIAQTRVKTLDGRSLSFRGCLMLQTARYSVPGSIIRKAIIGSTPCRVIKAHLKTTAH